MLQIWGIYRFNRLRGLMIIEKRYPQFVMAEAIVSCLMLAIIHPANNTQFWAYPAISGNWWYYLCNGLYAITFQVVPSIETCRIWLIFYDLQYLHSSKNQQWKTEIDASYAQKDWYLRNRGKWGNQRYIMLLGFIYCVVVSIAYYISVIMIHITGEFKIPFFVICSLLIIDYIVHMVIPLCLYVKTPRNLQDLFLFHFEFTYTAIIMTIILLGTILWAVPAILEYDTVSLIVAQIHSILLYLPSLMSTLVIPWKVNSMADWQSLETTPKLQIRESSGDFSETLQEILSDEQNCEAFIDWMYREFCSEVILSFLEFLQFRNYVKDEIGKTNRADIPVTDSDPFGFILYDEMPKSSIVYDPFQTDQGANEEGTPCSRDRLSCFVEDLEFGAGRRGNVLIRCKRIAHLLFKKYIERHCAVHEINISARMRIKYVDLEERHYDGMDLVQFLTLYDDVISEMMKYQHQSYERFRYRECH